jgi:diguanylate cyclase (GGDEF)-like protein/PAS domain S-box-containing protein
MTAIDLTAGRDPGPDMQRRRAFASTWSWLLRRADDTRLTDDDVDRRLLPATDRLADALGSQPFDPTPAASVGVLLIRAGFVGTAALRETIRLVGTELAALLDPPPGDLPSRLAAVQAELAAGFASAGRDRVVDEQETLRDTTLTAKADAQRALRASEARFRAVLIGAAIGIGLGTPDGRLIEVNDALGGLLGLPTTALVGRRIGEFLVGEDRPGLEEAYARLRSGQVPRITLERRLARPGGDETWLSLQLAAVTDESGLQSWHTILVEDITERRASRLTLAYQSTHDNLTGLANRAAFLDRLARLLRERGGAGRVGLCFVDLDGFKVINDSLGHPVGDQLLVAVADRIRDVAGPRLAARLGGDEFGLLLADTAGAPDVEHLAARLSAALAAPFQIGENRLQVLASVGVVERAIADSKAEDLIRAAELTMYRAKADGRGRWASYDPSRTEQQVARYKLSTAMPAALERDEFVLEFQPLVGLADGAVRGAEALVRWRHRELGLLSPKRFVGLAEESGAIVPLGRRVLQLACRQAARWPAHWPAGAGPIEGWGPYVSVNLATRQFRDPGLLDDVVRALDEAGLPPGRLQLELAADALTTGADRGLDTLARLAGLGVRLAVDDAGAGWVNLSLLRELPIDVLKLSGGLVQRLVGADRSTVDAQIIEALVTLAHTLGLQVVAEGIESVEQRDRLRELGCDTGQGWYFAPALGPDDFVRFLPDTPAITT